MDTLNEHARSRELGRPERRHLPDRRRQPRAGASDRRSLPRRSSEAQPAPAIDARQRVSGNRHRLKLACFMVALACAAAIVGTVTLLGAYWLRLGSPFCGVAACEGASPYLDLIPFAAAIRVAIALRRRPWLSRRPHGYLEEINEGIVDASIGSALLVLFTFFFRSGFEFKAFSYSRLVFAYEWVGALVLVPLLAVTTKWALGVLRRRKHNQRSVVVVRDREAPLPVRSLVSHLPELGYQIVAEIDVDSSKESWAPTVRDHLAKTLPVSEVDEILLLVQHIDRRELSALVGVSELAHIDLRAVPELFGLPPAKVSLSQVGEIPVLDLLQEPLSRPARAVKRMIDIAVSGALLILTAPITAAIAIAVRSTSAGPILVRQERIGMDGRPFEFLKFRSMHAANSASEHERYVAGLIQGNGGPADPDQGLFKLVDDPRVTRVGRVLRRYSLDELPQLMNVLRGDMSLVGPRPALPNEVSIYQDWHKRRLEVRPGLTGLWQVSGRSRVGFQDMVRLDIQYIETWSPVRDVLIMCKTVPALIRKETG